MPLLETVVESSQFYRLELSTQLSRDPAKGTSECNPTSWGCLPPPLPAAGFKLRRSCHVNMPLTHRHASRNMTSAFFRGTGEQYEQCKPLSVSWRVQSRHRLQPCCHGLPFLPWPSDLPSILQPHHLQHPQMPTWITLLVGYFFKHKECEMPNNDGLKFFELGAHLSLLWLPAWQRGICKPH